MADDLVNTDGGRGDRRGMRYKREMKGYKADEGMNGG